MLKSTFEIQRGNIFKTYLLIFLSIGLTSSIFYVFGWYFGSSWFAIIGLIISLFQAFIAYYFGDKMALSSVGAKEVTEEEAPQIHEMISNLSKVAGVTKPRIYISPDQSLNAFACGRDQNHASICFNQGIINALSRPELEGVAAHELGHVRNRDILIMTMVSVMVSVIGFLVNTASNFAMWGGMNRREGDDRGGSMVSLVFVIVASIVAPILATVIQLAVSRSREFLADASAVEFTRYPEGLINALRKLEGSPVPTDNYSASRSHFYIVEPKKSWGQLVQGLFSTHPPIEDRIAQLQQM
jgi:heat shock protein HtpX